MEFVHDNFAQILYGLAEVDRLYRLFASRYCRKLLSSSGSYCLPMYLLFIFTYRWTAWVMPPRMLPSNISSMLGSVRSSTLHLSSLGKLAKPVQAMYSNEPDWVGSTLSSCPRMLQAHWPVGLRRFLGKGCGTPSNLLHWTPPILFEYVPNCTR